MKFLPIMFIISLFALNSATSASETNRTLSIMPDPLIASCSEADKRKDQFESKVSAHSVKMHDYAQKMMDEVDEKFPGKNLEKAINEIIESQAITDENEKFLKFANNQSEAAFRFSMSEYLPDLDRKSLVEGLRFIKSATLDQISSAKNLDAAAKASMSEEIKSTKFILPDERTPELTPINQAIKDSVTLLSCGMGLFNGQQAIQAFNLPIQGRRYVILCPGLILYYLNSPFGMDSMTFVLAHEFAHSIDSNPSPYSGFQENRLPKTFERADASLIQCWDSNMSSLLKPPSELTNTWGDRSAAEAYQTFVKQKFSQLGHSPSSIEMHSHEMIADYWGAAVLAAKISAINVEERSIAFLNDNLIIFCGGSEADDGLHLPNTIRMNWLRDQESLRRYNGASNNSSIPSCKL